MEEYDSSSDSDIEPAVPEQFAQLGKQSIEAIVASAETLRLSSEQTIKTLKFGRGSPNTQAEQYRWKNRLDAFRQSVLKQNIRRPFTGDDIISFLDSIISVLVPRLGLPVPSTSTINDALTHILHYGLFRYPAFNITAHDKERISTWKDDATRAGRLHKGLARVRVQLTFSVLNRMLKTWLEHHRRYGVKNWDSVIARSLSVALQSAVCGRAGDIARSAGYEESTVLKYHNIVLELDQEAAPKIKNLHAVVTLEYVKGAKDVANRKTKKYFSALHRADQLPSCPIHLLIVHALRHDLVVGGPTLQGLERQLEQTGRVEWRYPQRPVLCGFGGANQTLTLDTPADVSSITDTLKHMGRVSGLLSDVYSHAIRYGAARDIAHLKTAGGQGEITESVRQAMGHSNSTMMAGVTEDYVGDSTREFFNERAAAQTVYRDQPKFAQVPMITTGRVVTKEEVDSWQQKHLSHLTVAQRGLKTERKKAREHIRTQRDRDFLLSAVPEDIRQRGRGPAASAGDKDGLGVHAPLISDSTNDSTALVLKDAAMEMSDMFSPDSAPMKDLPILPECSEDDADYDHAAHEPSAGYDAEMSDAFDLSEINPVNADGTALERSAASDSFCDTELSNAFDLADRTAREPTAGSHQSHNPDISTPDPAEIDHADTDGFALEPSAVSDLISDAQLSDALEISTSIEPPTALSATITDKADLAGHVAAVSSDDFIKIYSQINEMLSRGKLEDRKFHIYVGGSKDEPTIFMFQCRSCLYNSMNQNSVEEHQKTCDGKLQITCDRAPCREVFSSQSAKVRHIQHDHD